MSQPVKILNHRSSSKVCHFRPRSETVFTELKQQEMETALTPKWSSDLIQREPRRLRLLRIIVLKELKHLLRLSLFQIEVADMIQRTILEKSSGKHVETPRCHTGLLTMLRQPAFHPMLVEHIQLPAKILRHGLTAGLQMTSDFALTT